MIHILVRIQCKLVSTANAEGYSVLVNNNIGTMQDLSKLSSV